MIPPKDYATAQAYTGESEKLPIGGHICKIISARVEQARSGGDMLVLAFDINEGSPADGFYKRAYDRAKGYRADAKWPGVYRSTVTKQDGSTNPMFKGLITAIEKSNPSFVWGWDETALKGKFVGFNFGEEEYLNSQNEIRVNVKPRFPATVEDVRSGNMVAPALKKLGNKGEHIGGNSFTAVSPAEEKLPWEE